MSEKSRTFARVIELDRHIEVLLLSNDCVIVPDLGGFMAHHVDARYDDGDGMFVPPIRTLGFNPQLRMNDSMLVQSYIETYDISYPEALRRIEAEVTELRGHLETDGSYELTDIGILRLNAEGHIEFEPCEAGILTPELYGLSSFEMAPLPVASVVNHTARQAETKKLSPAQNTDDSGKTPDEGAITIKMSWLRNMVAVAAAVIAFFMIGTPVSNSEKAADVQQSSFINVSPHHRAASAEGGETVAAYPADDIAVKPYDVVEPVATEHKDEIQAAPVSNGTPYFCIVLASMVTESNALSFIAQLENKGFSDARINVTDDKRRVVYGRYASHEAAHEALKKLRSKDGAFKDAWVLKLH